MNPFGNVQLEFPNTFSMKAIVDAKVSVADNENSLKAVLQELDISSEEWRHRFSKENKYISFTFTVTVVDKPQFERMFAKLREIPSVKMLL